RDGVTPLSTTLDSIGPIANSIACCAITDAVMAGEAPIAPEPMPVEAMRRAGTPGYVVQGLAPEGANAFDACVPPVVARRRANARYRAQGACRVAGNQCRRRLRADRGLCLAPATPRAARRRLRSAGPHPHRTRRRDERGRLHPARRGARRSEQTR